MSKRKYGGPHRELRKRLARAVAAGQATCWRCGSPILPGARWHLGHSDDGRRWMGPEHAYCNTAAGARKTNAQRAKLSATAIARWSRHWYGTHYDERCPDCRARGRACDVATSWASDERRSEAA